jgi:hypothetical protein
VDDDDGTDDSNHNCRHPSLDGSHGGVLRGSFPGNDVGGGRTDDDGDSRDSNCNRYHPEMDSLAPCSAAMWIAVMSLASLGGFFLRTTRCSWAVGLQFPRLGRRGWPSWAASQ